MKHQRLVSSFTPSALQEWLEQELENRGIDSVYARSVLSLLQQDYVDIEPQECHHTRNRQLRVFHKYGGPENLYYVTKSEHRKWKTWGKHILLTSSLPCCKAAASDLERIMKKAAVDCLKTASDYDNDLKELINEVWIRLKNKGLKGETEDIAIRNRNTLADSFFIPPSSPTGEIEKYFAAFPSLSSQTEHSVEVAQQEMGKNDWWDRCILKRKAQPLNEGTVNSDNLNFHVNKNMQPIIPYRSLKTIKNIFENTTVKSLTKVSIKRITSERENSKIKTIIKTPSFPLSNLFIISINNTYINKRDLLNLYNRLLQVKKFNDDSNVYPEARAVGEICIPEDLNKFPVLVLQEKLSSITYEESSSKNYAVATNVNSVQISYEKFVCSINRKKIDNHDIDAQFKMASSYYPVYKYPCLELNESTSEPYNKNCVDTITDSFLSEELFCNLTNNELHSGTNIKSCFVTKKPTVDRENAFIDKDVDDYMYNRHDAFFTFTERHSYKQEEKFIINQSFNPLDTYDTSDEIDSNFSNLEQKYIENMTSFEFENSDDEIYYSDEDSNAILNACIVENFSVSSETHLATENNFEPLVKNNLSLLELSERSQNEEMGGTSSPSVNQYNSNFSLDTETKKIFINKNSGQKFLKKILSIGEGNISELINGRDQLSSSTHSGCSFIPFYLVESNETLLNEEFKHFQRYVGEKETGMLLEPSKAFAAKNDQKVFTSNLPEGTEERGQSVIDANDKKWLFHWGDNHNFIARTWQNDFVPAEKNADDQHSYDAEVSTALCKEIKEEDDESLKGLCSVPGISKTAFESEISKSKQNVHSDIIASQVRNVASDYEDNSTLYLEMKENQSFTADQILFNGQGPIVNNFAFHNNEKEVPDVQCASGYSVSFENNPFKAADFSDLSAFSFTNENINSFKDYAEGGGWSLASETVTDYYCDNPYERSSSMGNLVLEESTIGYVEFHQKRHCSASETDSGELPINKETETQLYKRMKQKFVPRKRPCSLFLQGTCARKDCKYSHDVSTITCRFWKEGSCFKGITCPFYHGFIKESDKGSPENNKYLRSLSPDLNYSLESESDFPSLSSTKSEDSIKKPKVVNIIQIKGSKRRRKEK